MQVSVVSQTQRQPVSRAVRHSSPKMAWAVIAAIFVGAFAAPAGVFGQDNQALTDQMRVIYGLGEKFSGASTAELRTAFESFTRGDVDKAFADLKLAKDTDKSLPPGRVLLARLFFAANRADFARLHLEQAVTENPESAEAYLLFGNLGLAEGRLNDALLEYQQALVGAGFDIRVRPEAVPEEKKLLLSQIYAGLTTVEERRGNWKRAAGWADFWKGVANEKEMPQAVMREARAMYFDDKDDQTEAAQKQLMEAIALDKALADKKPEPDKGKADFLYPKILLAQWATQKGGKDADKTAVKYITEALSEVPRDPQVHAYASRWYLDHNRSVEAQDHALEAQALDPGSDAVTLLGAIVSLHRKNYKDAEEKFRALYVKSPSDFTISNYLALALAGSGTKDNLARAQGHAEVNARSYSQSPEALSTLAWVYFNQGVLAEADGKRQDAERLYNDAEKLLTQAVSGQQAQPDTVYYLARVLAKRGRLNEAVQLLQKVSDVSGPFLYRSEASEWRHALEGTSPDAKDATKAAPDGSSVPAVTTPAVPK